MKKWILILPIMLICCFGSALFARAEEDFDFRKARWGMTIEEIKKTETAYFEGIVDESLYYTEKLLDKKCTIGYFFKEGKLVYGCLCFFDMEDEDSKLMFNTISRQLSKKYIKEKNYFSYLNNFYEMYSNDRSHIVLMSSKSEKGGRDIGVRYTEKSLYQDICNKIKKERMDDEKRRKKDLEMF